MDVIPIVRGSTFPITLELFQETEAGARINLTGYSLQVKESDFPFPIQPTITNAATGTGGFII
jgi:hypothetical protein